MRVWLFELGWECDARWQFGRELGRRASAEGLAEVGGGLSGILRGNLGVLGVLGD